MLDWKRLCLVAFNSAKPNAGAVTLPEACPTTGDSLSQTRSLGCVVQPAGNLLYSLLMLCNAAFTALSSAPRTCCWCTLLWHCSMCEAEKQSTEQRRTEIEVNRTKMSSYHQSCNKTLQIIFRKDRTHNNDKPQLVRNNHIKPADLNKSSACWRDVFITMGFEHCTCSPIQESISTGQAAAQSCKTFNNALSECDLVGTDVCWFA